MITMLATQAIRHGRRELTPVDVETATRAVELFKVLADPTRLRILSMLADGEQCVHRIAETMRMSQPAVSHHLRKLRVSRVVTCRREGRHVYYRLDDEHVHALLRQALEHVRHGWPGGAA
ncbi:ArsR/SmtB family transcription factor [Geochorda subterranea]|uniref:Metalloregulator ArsR/SmtB family transcription factor n=1 Tax=Geochorda subterranea TaxID=3109564 RepID=A0ABZ1BUS6_9FIRM|nr:metalloregulator ArsR/SmtB family transcription factor [Limnochorda sp. LNt]WRP15913.1 metalloregulator ArsR/SmtB family transcription factor [Limnochorda sp. LNt]